MIPLLVTAEAWIFAFALRTFGNLAALITGVGCLSFSLFAIKRQAITIRRAFVSVSVGAFVAIATVSGVASNNANQPLLIHKSFELATVRLKLESQLAPGFWKVELKSFSKHSFSVPALLEDLSKSSFQPGCDVSGVGRLVPNERSDRKWLLKLDANSARELCQQQGLADRLKSRFLRDLRGVHNDAKGLVAGLSIGDTSLLSAQTADQMKTLSLTHLTAVSGANCAIVLALFYLLFSKLKLRRWQRTGLSIGALSMYLLLVGPQPSVLRAAFMSLTILLMVNAGRAIDALTALCWATTALLLINPAYSADFGFTLSVAATAGILIVTPWLFRLLRRRMPSWLAAMISVSAAAQILCAPVLFQLQAGLPTYSILANLCVEPLVAPITILGLLACLTSLFGLSILASSISWLASLPAALIVAIVRHFVQLPLETIWWPAGWLGTCALASFATVAVLKSKNVHPVFSSLLAGLTALVVFFVAATSFFKFSAWPAQGWQLVNCNVGQGDSLLIRDGDQVALVDVGRDPKPIDDCLTRLSIHQIDLLVLTHFDADHVGGLSGALKGRTVLEGMLTDYPDDRPQAIATGLELETHSKTLVHAFAGMTGSLGRISWLVMQPEQGGAGSDDPNDGSITMRWDAPNFTLFTMADLGEKGQMRLTDLHAGWLRVNRSKPVVLKVSHHGSADQYPELIEAMRPQLSIISVGLGNPYGHPTARTLELLNRIGSHVFRTDIDGALSVATTSQPSQLAVVSGG